MDKNGLIKLFMVDDDEFFSLLVNKRLESEEGVEVYMFRTATEFLNHLDLQPDIAIIDYNLPDKNGIEILKEIKKRGGKQLASIILSGQKELDVVVSAYSEGAKRYIIKNENAVVELMHTVKELKENVTLKREVESLRDQIIDRNQYQNILGESPAIKNVFSLMKKVENIDIPILITGSNGTGKELVANALHYNSARKRKLFVPVNVAAIPEDLIENELFGHEKGAFTGASGKRIGKFEEANKGTIFLDEIGEMDINVQSKLLRVLQEKEITRLGGNKVIDLDIRIIAATNKNLWKEVQSGNFREDLYFRLQGFLIHLPALKDRGNDVILLAQHFAQAFCEKHKIPLKLFYPDAIKEMMDYSWPGNVRELKSMVERAILINSGEYIFSDDLVFLNEYSTERS